MYHNTTKPIMISNKARWKLEVEEDLVGCRQAR